MVKIHNLQEYLDIASGYCDQNREDDEFYWGSCYEWDITDPEQLSDPAVQEIFGSRKDIPASCLKNHSKYVTFKYTKEYGILLGVQVTEEDFYWIIKYPDKIQYITCVSEIIPLEN